VKISARVESRSGEHHVVLSTNGAAHGIDIPPKASGPGSSVNGGELLFLALATCYCNDIYREAGTRGIAGHEVEVTVDGQLGGPGDPARDVTYRARVVADAPEDAIRELMRHTDTVAEIQNTLRNPTAVTLGEIEAVTAKA
jgi:organic hydroperoxide reductase OsmC/OhrA